MSPSAGRNVQRRAAMAALAVVLGGGLPACGADTDADPVAFCEGLDRLATTDPFRAFGDRAGPTEIRAAFEALGDHADGLVDVAPDEVRPTARQLAGAVRAMDSLLAGAAYDGADVDTRAYRNEQVRYEQAAARLNRHLDSAC